MHGLGAFAHGGFLGKIVTGDIWINYCRSANY